MVRVKKPNLIKNNSTTKIGHAHMESRLTSKSALERPNKSAYTLRKSDRSEKCVCVWVMYAV